MNEEIDKLEVPEAKGRTHLFTRRAIADFVAFFTICAFFGSFVVFSAKYVKDDENRYNRPPRAVTPESEGFDSFIYFDIFGYSGKKILG